MTPDQEGLLCKARSSADAARLLLGEEHYDFAASRAYYAMFYVADAFLRGRDLKFSKHSAVHAAFRQHFARTGDLPAGMHRQLIEDAEDFIRVADERIGGPPPEVP